MRPRVVIGTMITERIPNSLEDAVVLVVLRALAQQLVRDLGVELRLAGADHLVDAGRRIRSGG